MRNEEDTYREGVKETLERMEAKIDKVDEKVTFTNGKVRKLILAFVALAFLSVGMGIDKFDVIISLLGL